MSSSAGKMFLTLQIRSWVRYRQLALFANVGTLGVEAYRGGAGRKPKPPLGQRIASRLREGPRELLRDARFRLQHRDWSTRIKTAVDEAHVSRAEVVWRSASLVYVHALVEDIAVTLCQTIGAVDYQLWSPQVRTKKVSIEETSAGQDALTKGAVEVFLKEGLRNKSLPDKIDLIHQKTGTPDMTAWRTSISEFERTVGKKSPAEDESMTWNDLMTWKYDQDELARIDQLRHNIVHRLDFSITSADLKKSEARLAAIAVYLIYIVGARWGLPSLLDIALKQTDFDPDLVDEDVILEFMSAFMGGGLELLQGLFTNDTEPDVEPAG